MNGLWDLFVSLSDDEEYECLPVTTRRKNFSSTSIVNQSPTNAPSNKSSSNPTKKSPSPTPSSPQPATKSATVDTSTFKTLVIYDNIEYTII